MKTVSKFKTIYRAFFKETEVPHDILADRRRICETCPYNSKNSEEQLSLIKRLQKQLDKPFCTQCGCFIHEKTRSATEACGREEQGETPFWNRLKIETTSKMKLNLINKTPELVNPVVKGEAIVLELGDVERSKLKDIYFDLELKDNRVLNFHDIQAGCRSCTKVFTKRLSDSKMEVRVNLNWKILTGRFNKRIVFTYFVKGERQSQEVIVNGKIL